MATLINSIRCIASDSLWYVKFTFFAVILFFMIEKYGDIKAQTNGLLVFPIFFLIMLGYAATAMHRDIANKAPLFPSIKDFPEVILRSIISSIVILPGFLFTYFIVTFVKNNFILPTIALAVTLAFIVCICLPFIFIPLVFYSVRNKITDIFRVYLILKSSGNFIVQTFSFILMYIFIIFLGFFLIYMSVKSMFGDIFLLSFIIAFGCVYSYFVFFIYCSNMYDDSILALESKS